MRISHTRSIQVMRTAQSILFDIPLYGDNLPNHLPLITVTKTSLRMIFPLQESYCDKSCPFKQQNKKEQIAKDAEQNETIKIE